VLVGLRRDALEALVFGQRGRHGPEDRTPVS
jgi:hypothetical protein